MRYQYGMVPARFTAIYIGANTWGATLDEARANLREAAEMVMEANRVLAEEAIGAADVIREPFSLSLA